MQSSKETIRKQILNQRKAMTATEVEEYSLKIQNSLIRYLEGVDYGCVLLYLPIANEVDLRGVIGYLWVNKKNVYVPKICGQELEIVAYQRDSKLVKESFGILTPEGNIIKGITPDITIVPCIACDKSKNRVGFGKGYYDKFLWEHSNTTKIGVCYDFQVVHTIATEEHDVSLDIIITDKQHIS